MAFFTREYVDYFKKLARNNKREWFHAHKKHYEQHVKAPFNEFVAEMIDRISVLDPEIDLEPREAIFRIARDIRFSKDKTPYKTHMAAVITPAGRQDVQYPGLYFYFGATGVGIGGGVYKPDKENLYRIRQAIKRDGKKLERALKAKAFRDLFGGELRGEQNKRIPKEFAEAAERFPFIANKQFFYFAEYSDPAVVLRKDLAGFVLRHYRTGMKVNEFLKAAMS